MKYKTIKTVSKNEGGLRTKGYFKKSYKNKPLISIITVVYNGDKFLEETIKSTINQSYENIEYIIIDGDSTDRSIEIIKSYEDKIDYWISEEDNGIYDAMNKGIILSTGKIIGIINSDDWYEQEAIKRISIYFDKECIITGDMNKYTNDLKSGFLSNRTENDLKHALSYMPINHPATFVSKSVYENIGLFNDRYSICADHEFILRALKNRVNIVFLKYTLANMRMGGISEDKKTILLRIKEHYIIRKEYLFPLSLNIIYSIYYFFKCHLKAVILSIVSNKYKQIYYRGKKNYKKEFFNGFFRNL